MLKISNRNEVSAFTTKDGSTIREILAPNNAPGIVVRQSLAEAILLPGTATEPHYHPITEELYYILHGTGLMQIENELRRVNPGDGIAIPPGAAHTIKNDGQEDLVFLCCCSPAYTHHDTVFVTMPIVSGTTTNVKE